MLRHTPTVAVSHWQRLGCSKQRFVSVLMGMVTMLQFSKHQMDLFQKTKLDTVCADIAGKLTEFRASGVDDATFQAWVRRRVVAYTRKAKIVQKRHIHLLCFWEASLGPDRFSELRAQGLERALTAKESETVRMDWAMKAFRRYLGA